MLKVGGDVIKQNSFLKLPFLYNWFNKKNSTIILGGGGGGGGGQL